MSLQFIGWGSWGREVLNICRQMQMNETSENTPELIAIPDGFPHLACEHFPDPISAEMYFVDKFSVALNIMGSNNRVHFVNMGENFSSGALCAFFKGIPCYKESLDFIVAYMPPPGTNQVAVGRLLTNLFGQKRFAETTFLLDGCAPLFCDSDERHIVAFAAAIGEILKAFERSCCMFPLILRMRTKVLSMAFDDIRSINSESSLTGLWRKLTVSTDSCTNLVLSGQDFLAFSVSHNRENDLAKVYEQNIPREKLLYLPFMRKYEWSRVDMPSPNGKNIAANFAGILNKCNLPERITNLMFAYYDACWPEGKEEGYERPDIYVEEWMQRNHIAMNHGNIQNFDLLSDAFRYIDSLKNNE